MAKIKLIYKYLLKTFTKASYKKVCQLKKKKKNDIKIDGIEIPDYYRRRNNRIIDNTLIT